jgi:hypothetical protein
LDDELEELEVELNEVEPKEPIPEAESGGGGPWGGLISKPWDER